MGGHTGQKRPPDARSDPRDVLGFYMTGRAVLTTSAHNDDYNRKRAEQRVGLCAVYWGCHGCNLKPSHEEEHRCKCGKSPGLASVMWGSGVDIGEEEKEERLTLRRAEEEARGGRPRVHEVRAKRKYERKAPLPDQMSKGTRSK